MPRSWQKVWIFPDGAERVSQIVSSDDARNPARSDDRSAHSFRDAKVDANDYFQIQNLVHRYAHLVDTGRWIELGELFAQADVYIGGKLAVSRDATALTALWRRYVRLYANGTPRTRHITTNLTIEPEGEDAARSHCYVVVMQQTDRLPLQPIIAGDYLDRFVKVAGVWRFSERSIDNDLFGDLRQHLLESIDVPEDRLPQHW